MSKKSSGLVLTVVVICVFAGAFFIFKDKIIKQNSPAGPMLGQPPMGGPMGAPMGGPAGNSEDFKQFQKLHQYTFQLMKLIRNIGRLDNETKEALTPTQAKNILAVLDPLRKLKSLDESTAKDAIKAMQAVLTDKQRSAISTLPSEDPFKRNNKQMGPPPPGGPMPSGPPPGGSPGLMGSEFNPLSIPPEGPGGQGRPGGMEKIFDDLKKKSGSKS